MEDNVTRVALTDRNGRISPVLDVAQPVLLLDARNGRMDSRQEARLPGTDPEAQAARLATLAPETLICGALSQPLAELPAPTKIRVIPSTAGDVQGVCRGAAAGRADVAAVSHFASSKAQLQALIGKKVTLMACPACLKAAGKAGEDLAEGVQVADKAEFFSFTRERILSLDY